MRGSIILRYRRAFAVAAALLWLLGVEVLPDAHLAGHRADHTHAANGSIVADHHHAGGHDDVDHPEPEVDRFDHTGEVTIDHDSPRHTAGGLLHRAVAFHQPAPPLVTYYVPRDLAWQLHAVSAPLSSIPSTPPAARGPPASPRLESVLDA